MKRDRSTLPKKVSGLRVVSIPQADLVQVQRLLARQEAANMGDNAETTTVVPDDSFCSPCEPCDDSKVMDEVPDDYKVTR